MTDKINRNNDDRLRYKSPEINMIEVKGHGVLCVSLEGIPGINGYSQGSDSHYGFGGQD